VQALLPSHYDPATCSIPRASSQHCKHKPAWGTHASAKLFDLFVKKRPEVFLQGTVLKVRVVRDRNSQAVQSPRCSTGPLEGGYEGQEGGVQLPHQGAWLPDHLAQATAWITRPLFEP